MRRSGARRRAARAVLSAADMHAIAFGTKRTFHGFLRVTRRAFASVALTAARYDLMSLLSLQAPEWPSCATRQSNLWRMLGVTPGVVSRMLRALEALGMVRRERPDRRGDRRQRLVSITALGRTCLTRVRRWMQRGLHRAVLHAICFGKHRDPDVCFESMCDLESFLNELRRHFGDRASLYFSWGHPDD